MPSLFSRLKGKDAGKLKSKKGANHDALADLQPLKPKWDDAYTRSTIEPEEIQDLIRRATEELKARGMTATPTRTASWLLRDLSAPALYNGTTELTPMSCSPRSSIPASTFSPDVGPERRAHLCPTLFRWQPTRRGIGARAAHDRAHGHCRRHEMVLEQTPRRCGGLGRL